VTRLPGFRYSVVESRSLIDVISPARVPTIHGSSLSCFAGRKMRTSQIVADGWRLALTFDAGNCEDRTYVLHSRA